MKRLGKDKTPPPPISCTQCGQQVSGERWVCPHCGTPLYRALDSQASYHASEKQFRFSIQLHNGIEQMPTTHSFSPFFILEVVVFILAIIVISVLAWMSLNKNGLATAWWIQLTSEKGEELATPSPLPLFDQSLPNELSSPSINTQDVAKQKQFSDTVEEVQSRSLPTSLPLFFPTPKDIENLPRVTIMPLQGQGLSLNRNSLATMRLTDSGNADYSPILSRDQNYMVYTSNINGHWQIIEAEPQTGKFIRQITDGEIDYYTPLFNEDGTQLLVVANWSVNLDIFLISFESGEVIRQLTFDTAADYAPAWLRDYAGIVFTSERDGNAEIYRMRIPKIQVDAPEVERITNDPAFDGYPSISKNGDQMVFYSDRAEEYNYDIYFLSLVNPIPRRLTKDPARDASPVFSPGDSWVIFESNRSGNYELYAIRPTAQEEISIKNIT